MASLLGPGSLVTGTSVTVSVCENGTGRTHSSGVFVCLARVLWTKVSTGNPVLQ